MVQVKREKKEEGGDRWRDGNGDRGREREKEEAPRLSRPNELSGSGTKIIIEISCR